ncbi:hypothetical protein GCM10027569_86730 [Flindersiella endophytica]
MVPTHSANAGSPDTFVNWPIETTPVRADSSCRATNRRYEAVAAATALPWVGSNVVVAEGTVGMVAVALPDVGDAADGPVLSDAGADPQAAHANASAANAPTLIDVPMVITPPGLQDHFVSSDVCRSW